MDTNHKSGPPGSRKAPATRRRHSLAFKRRLVEQTLVPGASVARIALDHGVNANLLFNWRRQHLRTAASPPPALLPVILGGPKPNAEASRSASRPAVPAAGGGTIDVELPAGRIRIVGAADVATLRLVLQALAAAA